MNEKDLRVIGLRGHSAADMVNFDTRNVVWLWQEDDAARAAGDDSREFGKEAWQRITGMKYDKSTCVGSHDGGDAYYELHRGGWVFCSAYDGEHVGIATQVVLR